MRGRGTLPTPLLPTTLRSLMAQIAAEMTETSRPDEDRLQSHGEDQLETGEYQNPVLGPRVGHDKLQDILLR